VRLLFVDRFTAKLHSSPAEESSDDISSYQCSHRQQHQPPCGRAESVPESKPFGALRPLADRHAVVLRVATATLHSVTAANAHDRGGSREATVETIRLVDGRRPNQLSPVADDDDDDDDDAVAVAENSPSDECVASAATASDAGCPSPWPSPHRTCPPTVVHAPQTTPAVDTDNDVFRAAPAAAALLTVQSCTVDVRPSVSSSVDGQTDWTLLSASDDSPLPALRPSLAADSAAGAPAHLAVPSSSLPPHPRDRMPTRPSRKSARAVVNFQSLTVPQRASKASGVSRRSTKREKKVTKTLAIVLGKAAALQLRHFQLPFDGRSTAYHTSQGHSDVTHEWPLTR